MFQRKSRIIQEQAILIEKKVFSRHDDAKEIRNLARMRRGFYHYSTAEKTDSMVYYLAFMTKKGRRVCYVDNPVYNHIKIDSLGILTTDKEVFVSFDFEKIATQDDVLRLNW